MRSPFIQKDDVEMPDSYGVHIKFINGKDKKLEVVNFWPIKDFQTIEFLTFDDERVVIPYSSIQEMNFDKRYSKLLELKAKYEQEQRDKELEVTHGTI